MQSTTLQAGIGGINRLRRRANVQPTDLYDLVNAYRQTGVYRKRQGLKFVAALDPTTFGLYGAQGTLHTFTSNLSIGAAPSGVTYHILPNPNVGSTTTINSIPFAGLFLGQLYIAALFTDGTCVHYWLGTTTPWAPNTIYNVGDVRTPTHPNGYIYTVQSGSGNNAPAWAPNVVRAVGNVIQPTVANGFKYTCINTIGANAASGATEPTWPTASGAVVFEDNTAGVSTPAPPAPTVSSPAGTRYGNMGGIGSGKFYTP